MLLTRLLTRRRRAGAAALAVALSASAMMALTHSAEAAPGGCKTLWVSPNGQDGATGTQKAPFKTLEQARDAIRDRGLTKNMTCDVTVNLEAGQYPVTSTIQL